MTKKEKAFLKEIKAVCEKHKLVLIPTSEGMYTSAHDPMGIVPIDDEWRQFLDEAYGAEDLDLKAGR
jgi:hypothetical protein